MTNKSDKDVVTIDWKGGSYTGEVSDGVPHGRGEIVRAVEIVEEEHFRGSDDRFGEPDNVDNFGQIRLAGGWYAEDKLFYSLEACAKYVGEFNSGQMEGKGTLTIVDGSTYVGQFKAGKWHGEGSWTHPDGDECSGHWKEGRMHGSAKWVNIGEQVYDGEWQDGLRHGVAIYIANAGDESGLGLRFEGDWFEDNPIEGLITYPTSVYEGEVNWTGPEGHGTMTYQDGTTQTGEWDDGEFLGESVAPEDQESTSSANSPFNNAQASAEEYEGFNAPDLAHIATLKKDDLIWVMWVGEDDESAGERFWLKVVENRESEITGAVENYLNEPPYEYGEEVVIPHNCVYDYIRSDAVASYREVFDDLLNSEVSFALYAGGENSTEGALRSERVMTLLRLSEKLTATYPTDINAHVESSGGWTDLGGLESGDALLTPSTADISTSNLEGGSVEVQLVETQEKFWIKVVRIDTSTGILYGLVKKEFGKAGLSRWQPVQCHVFQIWDAIFPGAKETLNLSDGGTYIGEMSDGIPSGEGIWNLADGTEYVGESKDGNLEGFGTMTDSDGLTYTGEWENDNRNGQGVLSAKDNGRQMVLSGEFKDGLVTGQVTEILTDGSMYVGGVALRGEGVCKEGHGTVSFLDGSEYVGEFKDGDPWSGAEYDKDGNVTATYSEGTRTDKQQGFRYPTDLEAHLESYGGWTDLSGKETDTPLLTPAKTSISKSIVQGGVVKVQHAESGERFWIEVVNYEPESGSIWGLVSNELFVTELDTWHPVVFHVFSVWDVLSPDEGERLSDGDKERVALVPSDHLPNTPPPEDHNYEGEVSDGEMHGFGTLTEPGGHVYVGEFRNNLRHGHGKQTFEDGGSYVGQFKAGEPHGLGTRTLADGKEINYEYREGIIVSSDGDLDFGTDGLVEYHLGTDAAKDDSPEMAFKWYKRSAELGYDAAQSMIGDYYWSGYYWGGEFVEPDDDEAIKWFRASAEQGHPWGLYELGRCYELGRGVAENEEEAFRYYKESFESEEDSPALTSLVRCYSEGVGVEKNTEKAIEILRKAAEAGDSEAQYELGNWLRTGTGVDKNAEEAFEWMTRAANAENEEAQDALTEMYSDGEGTELDLEEAVGWHRRLAESENAFHQFMLADAYWYGWGAEENNEKAAKWYREAAEQEMPFAFVGLGRCYELGFGVDQDEEEAFLNYQKGYEIGIDSRAVSVLARCYRYGSGVEQNIEAAKKLYLEAAESGDSDAKKHIGALYRYPEGREGFEPDMQEAMKWYRAGAEDGDSIAQSILGDFYWRGEFVDQDDQEAAKWYRASAEQEFPYGLYELGRCYDLGRGVEADKEKAFKLYMEALELDDDLADLVAEPLAEMYLQGNGVDKNYDEAQKWYYLSEESTAYLVQWMIQAEPLADVMDWIQSGISRGNADSMAALAGCYYSGTGVEEDDATAITWSVKATNLRSDAGLDILESIIDYLDDIGGEGSSVEEPTELETCLTRLAESGSLVAAKSLGKVYSNDWLGEENPELAFKWIRTAVEHIDSWDPDIKLALATFYMDGYGVDKNPEEGFKWFLDAAESSGSSGSKQVYECYRDGVGVGQDLEEAFKWLQKWAEGGGEEAAIELAQCYLEGKYVEQSYDEARNWFFKSEAPTLGLVEWMFETEELEDVMDWVNTGIANGDAESMDALAGCYYYGSSVEENNQLALKWAVKAATLGSTSGRNSVLKIVRHLWASREDEPELVGSLEVDPEEVETYLCGLAEDGDAAAAFALGYFYASQWHGKENPTLAVKFYRTTTEQGTWTWQGQSRVLLGQCYMTGYGVDKNPEEAFKWFLQAVEESEYWGLRDIYECYRDGIGVDKNPEEAEKWANRYKELFDEEIDNSHDHPEESDED